MTQIPKIEIRPYLEIILRRKWWIVATFVLVVIGGGVYYKTAPELYQASTLILVEPQKVPDSYVRSVVSDTVEKRLQTITQLVHSRTNLENVVHELKLDEEAKKKAESIIDRVKKKLKRYIGREEETVADKETSASIRRMNLVEALRKKIAVSLKGRGGNDAFEISFTWDNPEIAARVTNLIAEKYIEENLNVREEMAMATTDFLEREASRIRYELEAKEKELEDFKKSNMGMLPSELQSNMNMLNQLKDELNSLEKRLDTERQMAMMMEAQMRQMNESLSFDTLIAPEEPDSFEEETDPKMQDMEEHLKALRLRYTDSHPDIVAMKRRIERLKEDLRKEESANPEEKPAEISIDDLGLGSMDDTFRAQRDMQKKQIDAYSRQIEDVKKQIEVYRDRVERTPQVELAMTKILRDYETVRQRYEELLAKSLSARMAEELERRQKGEQFRIIDPAVAPAKPFSPDFKKIMFMAAVAGLGLGCGLAYLREMMDPCFYDSDEIEADLKTNVIINMPMADLRQKIAKTRKRENDKSAAVR